MKPLDPEQQAHFDKLIGEARVSGRELAEKKAATAVAAGKLGGDAQEALVLTRIAEAETVAREAAKTAFEAAATTAATKAAEDAATAKLVEDKRWEDLATQHSANLATATAELEPLKAKVTAYETLVVGMLEGALEELGDAAKAAVEALPGEPSALEKLVWLHQNEALFTTDPKTGPVGTPRSSGGRKTTPKKKEGEETTPGRISRWPLRL